MLTGLVVLLCVKLIGVIPMLSGFELLRILQQIIPLTRPAAKPQADVHGVGVLLNRRPARCPN